jgi:hypothetical protein
MKMSRYRLMLALCALAIVMLTGCKEPVGLPNNRVRAATIQKESCYISASIQTGHVDWYQGELAVWDYYDLAFFTITRAYNCYPGDPDRAYPRKNGFCIFQIPHFICLSTPACTLYYYQENHSGSASLLVNSWTLGELETWPPLDTNPVLNYLFWRICNSYDTVATDITHATDRCWYKVPLTAKACAAIRDSAAIQGSYTLFHTGWVYRDSVDGTFTDVSGYSDHPPFIRVVYDDGQ